MSVCAILRVIEIVHVKDILHDFITRVTKNSNKDKQRHFHYRYSHMRNIRLAGPIIDNRFASGYLPLSVF